MNPIPFIDLGRMVAPFRDEILKSWGSALDALEFVGGKNVAELENVLKKKLGAAHSICCANGTDAIVIGLQAMGVGPGKKVALPNLTFWATYEAIAQLGATPVLIDVHPEDLQLDYDAFVEAYGKHRFDAAILVHLYGWCTPRLKDFREFCRKQGVALLEDGAQSYGVEYFGESIYAGAQIATLSFYPAKVLGGCMDGGAITTAHAQFADKIRSLCNHGRATHYSYAHVGWNSRMSGLNARFLLKMCELSEQIVSSRARAEALYRELLQDCPGIKAHAPPPGVHGNGYLSVVEILTRPVAQVAEQLKASGIGTGRVYPETMDMQEPARGAIRHGDLKVSRQASSRILNLPLFYGITAEEIARSAEALKGALK